MVRKRNGVFYTDFYFERKRIVKKVPGGVRNKRVAEEWEADLKARMLREGPAAATPSPSRGSLAAMVEEYLRLAGPTKAPRTRVRDRECLAHFLKHAGDIPLGEINALLMDGYRAARREKVSARTVNLEVSIVKAMLNKAVEWEIIPANPIAKFKPLRLTKPAPVFLTAEEVEKLIEATEGPLRLIVQIAAYTGLRKGEIERLEWKDMDFRRGLITVQSEPENPTKSKKARAVPLPTKLREALAGIRPKKGNVIKDGENPSFWFGAWKRLKKDVAKAGIEKDISLHSLRHTYASHLAMSGKVTLTTLQAILGHADIQTTMRYAHLMPGAIDQARDVLPY